MKEKQDYIRDLSEMRSLMERSSKFLSLSGLAGIIAGIYALAGAFITYKFFSFPEQIIYSTMQSESPSSDDLLWVAFLAIIVLILAIATAILLSYRKAYKRHEKFWSPTTIRVLISMSVPLITGGLLILIFISEGLIGLVAPLTLIFYGLALYNAGKFTYTEIKNLGLTEIGLGLISAYFIEYGLLFWALGFGIVNIIYGIYIHYRSEK